MNPEEYEIEDLLTDGSLKALEALYSASDSVQPRKMKEIGIGYDEEVDREVIRAQNNVQELTRIGLAQKESFNSYELTEKGKNLSKDLFDSQNSNKLEYLLEENE